MANKQIGYGDGFVSDQTELLQIAVDGLAVYNKTIDPIVDMLSQEVYRQTMRVNQAPKHFKRKAEGITSNSQASVYRLLNAPLDAYDLNSEFTIEGLQDMLPSDIETERNAAIAGDAELVNTLFFQSMFTKQTVGSVGTAYQAGFYNGELDVPSYKNNSFASAHYHYLGINTTTLAPTHIHAMTKDIQEHGFGLTPGSRLLFANTAEADDLLALMDTNASSTILQAITAMREKAIDGGMVNTGVTLYGARVVITDDVPAGYLAMVATDVKPIARRVHLNPAYRGLQLYSEFATNPDYPLANQQYMRRIGFGVQQMGAGTCRQIVGSATYTNPTFTNPAN